MQGALALTLACVGGRTRPTHLVALPPLQCSRARYDHPQHADMACLTLLHLGGVLQGDQLDLAVVLEPDASAYLTTAAATQVYRMPEHAAQQTTAITLHPRSRLLYLPEPTILFAGARFSQATRIVLHEGATLVLREMLVAGRLARHERHQYERYCSQFEVCDSDGQCLLSERARIEPAQFPPTAIGVQGPYPVVGSLYILALHADTEAILADAWRSLSKCQDVPAGAGALPNSCGVLVRALGSSTQAVRRTLDSVQHALAH